MTTEQKGRACSQQVTGPNNTTTTVDTAEHNPLPPLPLPQCVSRRVGDSGYPAAINRALRATALARECQQLVRQLAEILGDHDRSDELREWYAEEGIT